MQPWLCYLLYTFEKEHSCLEKKVSSSTCINTKYSSAVFSYVFEELFIDTKWQHFVLNSLIESNYLKSVENMLSFKKMPNNFVISIWLQKNCSHAKTVKYFKKKFNNLLHIYNSFRCILSALYCLVYKFVGLFIYLVFCLLSFQ